MATQRRYGHDIKELKKNTQLCFYCGKKMSRLNKTVDHIIPIKKSGSNNIDNVVICCRKCNNIKGGYTLYELIEQMKKRYRFADEKTRVKIISEISKWERSREKLAKMKEKKNG